MIRIRVWRKSSNPFMTLGLELDRQGCFSIELIWFSINLLWY